MDKPVLTVEELTTKLYVQGRETVAVNALSFELFPGKTLALVGESGCGKTLTALSLMRILPNPPFLPSQGRILYNGVDLLQLSEHKMRKIRGSKIAMIFQDPSSALNPVYMIGDQLMEVAGLHLNLYGEEAFALAAKALTDVGIPQAEDRLYDYPHQLSGGMRQRVMIAMAIMCEPDILIADEPTTALDVTIQAQVLELITELQERKKTALLLITHDMGVVAEMADEVIVMYASEAIERGGVNALFDKMAHPYTQGLFNSRPSGIKKPLQAIEGAVPPIGNYPSGCKFHPRCPYKMKKCCDGAVSSFPINGSDRHTAHCWLWDGTSESNEARDKVK